MFNLLSMKSKLKFNWGVFLFVFLFPMQVAAQINYNNDFSQTEIANWFEFEPGEEFVLEGSTFFMKEASTVKLYPTVANFFSFFENSKNSLGVKLSWDRVGSHYADIIPKKILENPHLYPVDNLESLSLWVWSAGNNHELAVIFLREDGYAYSLKLTKLNFHGWKKIKVNVPLVLKSKVNSAVEAGEKYYFDRFRIYTSAKDKVGEVYVFLDKMIVVEELYRRLYDGLGVEEIIRKEKLERIRGTSGGSQSENSDLQDQDEDTNGPG